jgi:uncharacterized repeat protein (TIGR01451 family)
MTRLQVRRLLRTPLTLPFLTASLIFAAVLLIAGQPLARAADPAEVAALPPLISLANGGTDLSVSKSANPDPALAGRQLTYPVTVTNHSTVTTSGIVLTDTLPLQVEYVADTGGCTLQEGTGPAGTDQVVCPLADLGPGESYAFQIVVSVPADAVASDADGFAAVTNTVEVTSGLTETNPSDNLYTLQSFIQDQADLQVAKVSTPETSVPAGETFTYTIFVDNYGPSYARNVALRDNILAANDVTVLAINDDPNRADSCSLAGDEIQCTLSDPLEPVGVSPLNGRWTVTIVLRSNEPQEISNSVQVFSADPDGGGPQTGTPDPDPTNNQATDFIAVTAVADLQIAKTAQGQVQVSGQPGGTFTLINDQVTAGGLLTYTVTVQNLGPSTARNVAVEDHPSPWITVQAMAPSQGLCYTDPSEGLICALGDLGPSDSATIRIVAKVPPGVSGGTVLESLAMVHSDVFDPDNTNDYAANETTVNVWADLAITKTARPSLALTGSPITYTIVVQNLGPSNVQGAIVTDTIPIGIEDAIWQCTSSEGGSCTGNGTGDIGDTVDLQAGGTITYVVQGTLEASHPITNTATVAPPTQVPDPFDTNNSASVSNIAHYVYLPMISGGSALESPDLIVDQIIATPNDIQVVIRNVGNGPVNQGFWVDVYIDPDIAPRQVNQVWGDLGDEGLVWGVKGDALPLAPNEAITLTVGDAYYREELSRVTWPLPSSTPVYAQVDSYGDPSYGLVQETHEISGGTYNNILGPVLSSAGFSFFHTRVAAPAAPPLFLRPPLVGP